MIRIRSPRQSNFVSVHGDLCGMCCDWLFTNRKGSAFCYKWRCLLNIAPIDSLPFDLSYKRCERCELETFTGGTILTPFLQIGKPKSQR